MAVGKAGEPADRDLLSIRFGDILVAEKGERVPGYSEEEASAYMRGDEIDLGADLGLGAGVDYKASEKVCVFAMGKYAWAAEKNSQKTMSGISIHVGIGFNISTAQ